MLFNCGCGWSGEKLTPDYQRNVARCPTCRKVFEGVQPKGVPDIEPNNAAGSRLMKETIHELGLDK